jgi:hypothetical protein
MKHTGLKKEFSASTFFSQKIRQSFHNASLSVRI